MYLTQKNQIRGLKSSEFESLRQLCRLSKNLYNVGLYTVKQYYFQEQKDLRYESNYHYCKSNENYQMLNTDIAQQTLKVVDRTFRSFYGLITAVKSGTYSNNKVRDMVLNMLSKRSLTPVKLVSLMVMISLFTTPSIPQSINCLVSGLNVACIVLSMVC
ncbi:hypothetical protein LAY41_04170 [Argonema galeatum A003/A1]|nr:hypothetical protein [Argonema galeatum A003/A1]